ncbi:hypothetical protein [Streptomyces sp. NPDC094032]|uniref:hypothetical protein n=1 Tax=Streptomyces sp. NPDC094032 TaxID=3155308 RepID=UPI0033341775
MASKVTDDMLAERGHVLAGELRGTIVTLSSGNKTAWRAPVRPLDGDGDQEQPEPVFPVELQAAESVEPYEGEHHRAEDDGQDWTFTTAAGHGYRLCSRSYGRDRWQVARAPFSTIGSSSGGWFWWAESEDGDAEDLAAAVEWCRKDSASAAWAADVWARYGHMNSERVEWSAESVETELEPRVWRVERYGRVGIMASYPWGWERSASGWLMEAGSGGGAVDGAFRKRAVFYLTREGLDEIPTDRWVIVGTDEPHGNDAMECAPGGWEHSGCRARKSPGRFVVDILAEGSSVMGRVGVCAEHLTRRLVEAYGHQGDPWDVAHKIAGKVGGELGSWVAWKGRLHELVAEMVTAALAAGETNPHPDVAAALYAEAEAIRAKREAKAAKSTGTTKSTVGEKVVSKSAPKADDIQFSGEKGRERAELLGHTYVVSMLAGTYTVTHVDSGETVCEYEPKRPAMKRAILADAVARGEAQPEPGAEERPESDVVRRFPELARFLEPRGDDAPLLVLNLFSGPGGMVIGLRDVLRQQLGRDVEIINVDNDADCVRTLKAAGFLAIQANVTSLDPSDPVFHEVRGLIVTPPCTDYTDSGKRAGLLPENIDILEEGFDLARRVAGFIPFGGMGDYPEFGKELSHKEPNGETWADVRADMADYSGATGHLMLEVAVWSLGLQAAGAPLEWVAVEQSSKLPKELRGEIVADFQLSGWGMAEWTIADAAEFGSPTQRVRSLLVARRDGHSGVSLEAPGLRTGAATATGLPEGTQVFTRGVGKRTGGGNVVTISDAKPYTAFTSRIRSVDVGEKGGRFTIRQILSLITMPHDYPVQGSRTSVCQQIGDVVAPVVAAALLGAALGIEWMPRLVAYLAKQYGADAADTEEPAQGNAHVPAGRDVEVQERKEEAPAVRYEPKPRALRWEIRHTKEVLAAAGHHDNDQDTTRPHGFFVMNDMHAVCVVPVLNNDPRRPRKLADRKLWDERLEKFAEILQDAGFTDVSTNLHRVRGFAPVPAEPQTTARVRDVNDWATHPKGYRLRSVTFDGFPEIECRIGFFPAGAGASSFHLQNHEQNAVPSQAGETLQESVERLCDWYGLPEPFQVIYEERGAVAAGEPVWDPAEHVVSVRAMTRDDAASPRTDVYGYVGECSCGGVTWYPTKTDTKNAMANHKDGRVMLETSCPMGSTGYVPELEEPAAEDSEAADECSHHPYVWLVIDPQAAPEVRSALTCACGGERLGTRGASRTAAWALADRNGHEISGEWETVGDVHRAPVVWKHADKSTAPTMTETLEKYVGPDWKPGCTFNDPEFPDDQDDEEMPAQDLAQISRAQRRAIWRIEAGESAPVDPEEAECWEQLAEEREQPERVDICGALLSMTLVVPRRPVALPDLPLTLDLAPVSEQPNTGRGFWEPNVRFSLDGRTGRTSYSAIGKGVRVLWDDNPNGTEYADPRALWVEGTEPEPFVRPEFWDDDDYVIAPPAPKPYVQAAHYDDDDYVLAAPVVGPLAELRAEIERERADFERWSAELDAVVSCVEALAVAAAEDVIRQAQAQAELLEMKLAELSVMRRQAADARRFVEPIEWEPVPTRARPWRTAWAVTASWGAFWAAAWAESIDVIRPVR